MSYCPEDGTKMVEVVVSHTHSCYECPSCHIHWCYDAELGAYSCESDGQRENCRICEEVLPSTSLGYPVWQVAVECRDICHCADPKMGYTYYECNYGHCGGYKCEACGEWWSEQVAHCCKPYNRGKCPDCAGVV